MSDQRKKETHPHLLGLPELFNLAVTAGCDALIFDVEVLFKPFQLVVGPVDSAEAASNTTHFVVAPATSASTTAVTSAAVTASTTAITSTVAAAVTSAVALQDEMSALNHTPDLSLLLTIVRKI